MTPIAGFIAAVIAGWMVRRPRRAAAIVLVPYLVVTVAQSWLLASGRGTSPPSTVTGWPGMIGYWLVQAIFLALSLGIAAELAALRARRAGPETAADLDRRTIRAAVVEAALTVVFLIALVAHVVSESPVRHHSANGSPPIYGVVGMVLCFVTFAVLSVLVFRGRGSGAKAAGMETSALTTGGPG